MLLKLGLFKNQALKFLIKLWRIQIFTNIKTQDCIPGIILW